MPLTGPEIEELIDKSREHYCEEAEKGTCVKIVAVAEFPTRFGDFQIVAFYNDMDEKEHVALVKGDVFSKKDVPVRIHSECLTGDSLGSLRCDCRDQLTVALKKLAGQECGVLLYLRQEGRGIGLLNKMKAYQLQDLGYDTMEANEVLGFRDDERDYAIAAHMLRSLKIVSITLMTNNPKKIEDLKRHGIKVSGRIPLVIPPNEYNKRYLETKMKKGGHMLEEQVSGGKEE